MSYRLEWKPRALIDAERLDGKTRYPQWNGWARRGKVT